MEIIAYHGTRRKFSDFEPMQPIGIIGNPSGVYFSEDIRTAKEYAMDVDGAIDEKSRIIKVKLTINSDNDGKIIHNAYSGDEIVMFNNDNIEILNYNILKKSLNESVSSISLNDIYGSKWEVDESESILGFVDSPSDWELQFPIISYKHEQLKTLEVPTGSSNLTVFDAYKKYATKEQKEIVKYYINNDKKRNELPIVIANKSVLDGNHRLIAAILKNVPINVIDVYGEEYTSLMESINDVNNYPIKEDDLLDVSGYLINNLYIDDFDSDCMKFNKTKINVNNLMEFPDLVKAFNNPEDINRINKIRKNMDITYPIYLYNGEIIAGVHRAIAYYLEDVGLVTAYEVQYECDDIISLNESINSDITYTIDHIDNSRGQNDYQAIAKINDSVVGIVDFATYNNEVFIKMIEINENYKRMGIATKLIEMIQKEYPTTEIDFGLSTDDGSMLLQNLRSKNILYVNPYKEKQINALNELYEKLSNIKTNILSKETLSEHDGELLNKISDYAYDAEQEALSIDRYDIAKLFSEL